MPSPTIWWVRKDFRLSDNAALSTALDADGPLIILYIFDPVTEESIGAAPTWRLGKALAHFAQTLEKKNQRLILRRGEALSVLKDVIEETKAERVVWGRQYDEGAKQRDTAVKAGLKDDGIDAVSVCNHLLIEPWKVETKTGGPYRVYSPYKRACFEREDEFGAPLPEPGTLKPPQDWPKTDDLADWQLGAAMNRGAASVGHYAGIGSSLASDRLNKFLEYIDDYDDGRNLLGKIGTSRLSENFAWGEISTRTAWVNVRDYMTRSNSKNKGAEVYLQELLWREFAYHLLHHYPAIERKNWRDDWDAFPWRDDNDDAERWRRGMTGIRVVDAAMRELYATGYMHNRMRMLTGSLLTKHLMTHWRVGEAWFRNCLIDWDPASNAMGWQWVAGSGPDASPFFRIFNPDTQQEKFDKGNKYVDRWLRKKSEHAQRFFAAVPRSWGLDADTSLPEPMVDLKKGRQRALDAYRDMKDAVA